MRSATRWIGFAFGLVAAFAQAQSVVTAPTVESAVVGALAADGVAQGTLLAGGGGVAFHTYWVDLPPGVARWTLTLEADVDLDLAIKAGSEMRSYNDRDGGGDWDYRDVGTGNPTVIVIDGPAAGRWYVDVFNALRAGTRGNYRLTLAVAAAAATPAPPVAGGSPPSKFAPAPPTVAPASTVVTAPSADAMVVGQLPFDGVAAGALLAASGGNVFHTYVVDLPTGLARWTLTLDADADLDLALKYGSEIQNYADRDQGGDWDHRDLATTNPTVMVVEGPGAGRWYVDVFTMLQPGTRANYRLTLASTPSGGALPSLPAPPTPSVPTPATPTPVPPAIAALPAVGFGGSYRQRDGEVLLALQQDAGGNLRGTLGGSGAVFTVEGVSDVNGTYGIIYDDQGGVFFAAALTATGLELTLYDADAQGQPIEQSARVLVFDRIGGAPQPADPAPNPLVPPGGALPSPPSGVTSPSESGTMVELRVGAQAGAGDRARNAFVGTSLVVPPEWQAWVSEEPLLPLYVGSHTQPGFAVVLGIVGFSLQHLGRVLSEPIDFEDGTTLHPVGAPQPQGDLLVVHYQGAGGVGVGLARSAGAAGVLMLYLGGLGNEAVGTSLLQAMAASLRFESPEALEALQRVRQDWSGYRMWTYAYGSGGASNPGAGGRWSSEYEAHWDLCADGRYLHDARSESGAFAGASYGGGLAPGTQFFGGVDQDRWSGRGQWVIGAIGDRVVLVLFDELGSWSYYVIGWEPGGSYRLDDHILERRRAEGC